MDGNVAFELLVGLVAAVAFVVAVRTCPLVLLVAASALALVLTAGSVLGQMAAAGAGVAAAAGLVREQWRFLPGAAGLGLLVAFINLESVDGPVLRVGVACLVLGGLGIVGVVLGPMPQRRRLARFGGALLAGAFLAMLLAAPAIYSSANRIRTATAAFERAAGAASAGEQEQARSELRRAEVGFRQAERSLNGPSVKLASGLPVVGRQLQAVRVGVAAASDVATAALDLSVHLDVSALAIRDGRINLEGIRELIAPAGMLKGHAVAARRRLVEVRNPWLLPYIRRHLDAGDGVLRRLESRLVTVESAARVAPVMLGANGPRRYFLALQNPAEARGGGGIISSFAEITVDHGALTLARTGTSADLNPLRTARPLVAPPEFIARYGGSHLEQFWQNMPVSPDFPTTGSVIVANYERTGGEPLDGVVSLDPTALAGVLSAIGPVKAAELGEISSSSVERLLEYEQYVRFDQRSARFDFLGAVFQQVWGRITAGVGPDAPALGRALAPSISGRHLMMYSERPVEEGALRRLGVSGAVPRPTPDELAVVVRNTNANKMDWFLHRSTRTSLRRDGRGGWRIRVAISLTNDSPASGLPDYIIGAEDGLPKGTYRAYVSLYSGWGLNGLSVGGVRTPVESQLELGRRVYSVSVLVPPGGKTLIDADFERLAGSRPVIITSWRQPTIHPERGTVRLIAADGRKRALPWWGDPRHLVARLVPSGR